MIYEWSDAMEARALEVRGEADHLIVAIRRAYGKVMASDGMTDAQAFAGVSMSLFLGDARMSEVHMSGVIARLIQVTEQHECGKDTADCPCDCHDRECDCNAQSQEAYNRMVGRPEYGV